MGGARNLFSLYPIAIYGAVIEGTWVLSGLWLVNYDCAEERRSFKSVFATDLKLLLLFKNSIISQIQKEPGRVVWFFCCMEKIPNYST